MRVTTDNAGTLSNQQAHYPYGENWYATGTADGSVQRKFTSYRKEGGSLASGQINYATARYHGARIGRFHRPDPVRGNFRNPQRLNRYAYVRGDPVRRRDPLGLSDMSDGIGAEWQCPGGLGSCIIPLGSGLMQNPNASGGGMGGYNVLDAIGDGNIALANILAAGNNPTLNYINQQNGYTDWVNAIPVGCWLGTGFQDEECLANGGDGSAGGSSGGIGWLTGDRPRDCAWEFVECVGASLGRSQDCADTLLATVTIAQIACMAKACRYGWGIPTCILTCLQLNAIGHLPFSSYCLARFSWNLQVCLAKRISCGLWG